MRIASTALLEKESFTVTVCHDAESGLTAGADDYMAKPYSARELVARIRAVQRRPRRPARQLGPGGSTSTSRTCAANLVNNR